MSLKKSFAFSTIGTLELYNLTCTLPWSYQIVDVRPELVFKPAHISQSLNMPLPESLDETSVYDAWAKFLAEKTLSYKETVVFVGTTAANRPAVLALAERLATKEVYKKNTIVYSESYTEFCRVFAGLHVESTDESLHSWYAEKSWPSCIVEDQLFLSDWEAAHNTDALKHWGIQRIVNLTTEEAEPDRKALGLKEMFCHIDDIPSANILEFFSDTIAFITEGVEKGERVLIHCMAGVSRSATITIAFLMTHRGWNLKDAITHVKKRRHIIYPNGGFLQTLIDYERSLHGTGTLSSPAEIRTLFKEYSISW